MKQSPHISERIWRKSGGNLIQVPPPKQLILARRVPILRPESDWTFEAIVARWREQTPAPHVEFVNLLEHAWKTTVFLDHLKLTRVDEDNYHRIIPGNEDSEFKMAELCARYSMVLHSALYIASDFPEGITGVELYGAVDDFINRASNVGTSDRLGGTHELSAGWKERIAPFNFSFVWNATSLVRSLTHAIYVMSERGLEVSEENRHLASLSPTAIDAGDISALSQTQVILKSCNKAIVAQVDCVGKSFFKLNAMMVGLEKCRGGIRKIVDADIPNRLPIKTENEYLHAVARIRDEMRECARRARRDRKKLAKKKSRDSTSTNKTSLTGKYQQAFDLIKNSPNPIKGAVLASKLEIDETTFRKHYVSRLRPHGVRNDGSGYYIA